MTATTKKCIFTTVRNCRIFSSPSSISLLKKLNLKSKGLLRGEYLYHFILDEEEVRVSEGWFPTQLSTAEPEHYTVKMKAKKGLTFQPGKKYRLCVGSENPDAVFHRTNYYKCLIDYEFEIPEK